MHAATCNARQNFSRFRRYIFNWSRKWINTVIGKQNLLEMQSISISGVLFRLDQEGI